MSLPQILIVDTDPAAALVTQHGLQRLLDTKAEVTVVPSATTAWLRCLREHVDLVIIDPSPMNSAATALIKALHVDRPHTAVLVLTAYDTPRLRSEMRALGVEHYLAKPIDLDEISRQVGLLIDQVGQPIS
jgi:DNA-binding NarL/FixJ family response regulator